MAKNKVEIDVNVDDKGTTKKLGLESKAAAKGMDDLGRGSRTADRNIKGAAQASANGTKNFSKMGQGMGGLVGVYATLAASAFALSAAFQFLKGASDFRNLLEGQKALGAVTGVAYKTITNSVIAATDGQLKYADAAKAAAIGTASGLSPEQLSRLGAAAKTASVALGRDLGDSFDRLIRGTTKAEPELLDELGIILRLEAATEKYGLQIGKAAGDLNAFERSQAVANEVLEQAERKFGAMEKLMDPNAAALNQFGKAFDDVAKTIQNAIAGPMAGIATFLSENILSLISVLGLFAAGILKQVLPSMSAWKDSSKAAMEAAKTSQQAIRAELQQTRLEYAKLNQAQRQTMLGAQGGAQDILKGFKPSKSGQGATEFLTGGSDSKKAQTAADKALSHFEAQTKANVKKRTGMFKDMTVQQVADLRTGYNLQAGIIKEGERKFTFSLKNIGNRIKLTSLTFQSFSKTVQRGFAFMATAAARFGAALSKAFFYVGIAVMAFDAFKMVYRHFNPISEATKELNKQVKEISDRYSTLTEEVGRTIKVLNDFSQMNLTPEERIQSTASSVQSMDVNKVIEDINFIANLPTDSDMFKELQPQVADAVNQLITLDNRFRVLGKSIRSGGKVTDLAAQQTRNLSNHLLDQKRALSQMPETIQGVNKAFTALVGSMKKPFGSEYKASLNTMVTDSKIAAEASGEELAKLTQKRKQFVADNTSLVYSAVPNADGTPDETGSMIFDSTKQQELNNLDQLIKEATDSQGKFNSQVANASNGIAALEKRQTRINELLGNRASAEKTFAEDKTRGVTLSEKITNLESQNTLIATKRNTLEAKKEVVLAAQGVLLAKQADKAQTLTKEEEESLSLLTAQKDQMDGKLSIIDSEVKLETIKNNILVENLKLQRELSKDSEKRLNLELSLVRAKQRTKFIEAGGTGSFGRERGVELANQQRITLQQQLRSAQQKQQDAQLEQTNLSQRTGDLAASPEQLAAAERKLEISKQNVALLNQEITLFGNRGQAALLNVKADTEAARLRFEALSANPVVTEFNTRLNALKERNIILTTQQKESLYAELEAQQTLNDAYERKVALFDTLESSLADAFTGIIDGTKTAKEAFADMAKAILGHLARMVAEMMAARIIQAALSSFGGGGDSAVNAAGKTVHSGASNAGANIAAKYGYRNGGIATPPTGYSTGGIAKGSTSGYPAILHGTEAVVPLPNGKTIPVEMKSGGQQTNNVTVNVSVDKNGSASSSASGDDTSVENFGKAISKAIQDELSKQQRSGGMLSPYGV